MGLFFCIRDAKMDIIDKVVDKIAEYTIDWVKGRLKAHPIYTTLTGIGVGFFVFVYTYWTSFGPLFVAHIEQFLRLPYVEQFGIVSAITAFLYLVIKILVATNDVAKEYIDLQNLKRSTGLAGFFPLNDSHGINQAWETLRKELTDQPPTNLKILAITGARTFGLESSPLHKVLESFGGTGKIHILLINPLSSAFEQRIKERGIKNKRQYLIDLETTVAFCKALHDGALGARISVKLYDQMPIWKMVFANGYLWLQCYDEPAEIGRSPVYTINTDGSLHKHLDKIFEKRWEYDNSISVDFSALNAESMTPLVEWLKSQSA